MKVLNWLQTLTVFGGLCDTEGSNKKGTVKPKISFKYLFLCYDTSATTQLKPRSVAVREMLHPAAACCTHEVVLVPFCLYWPSLICWNLHNSCSVIKAHSKSSWLHPACFFVTLGLGYTSVYCIFLSLYFSSHFYNDLFMCQFPPLDCVLLETRGCFLSFVPSTVSSV